MTEAHARRRREWRGSLLVLALAAGIVAVRQLASWDVWWHLAIGRAMLETGSLLPADTFSYSHAGAPFPHKDWLGDIVLFGSFELFGFAGVALLRAAVVGLLGLGLLFGPPKAQRDPITWLAITLLLVLSVQSRIIPRPLMATIGLFPLMLALIERARRRIPEGWRAFARAHVPILALQWFWLQLHRGGILGLVLLGGHIFALLLAMGVGRWPSVRSIAGPLPTWRHIVVSVGAFFTIAAAGMLHPSGWTLYASALSVTHDDIHRTRITEWQPLTIELAQTLHPIGMALLAVGGGVLIGRMAMAFVNREDRSPVHLWHLGVLALFVVQGVQSMRWLSYAYGAAAFALILVTSEWSHRSGTELRPRGLATILGFLGCGLLHLTSPSYFGLGEEDQRYPQSALAFAEEQGLSRDVHNAFVYGGYLTWFDEGRHRVLIDGRNDMLYPSAFYGRCVDGQRDPSVFEALQAEWPTDWVLAENVVTRESFAFLAQHPDWMPVYWSDPAVIYVRRDAYPQLAPLAFRHIHPVAVQASLAQALQRARQEPALLAEIFGEIERMHTASPDALRPNALLALALDATGRDAERDAVILHLLKVAPDSDAAQQLADMFDLSPPD